MPVLVGVVIIVVLLYWSGVKIVREYQRLIVFRLGRSMGAKGPGIVYLIPVVDRAVWGDLRELSSGDPRADLHHQGQRADLDRLPHLL